MGSAVGMVEQAMSLTFNIVNIRCIQTEQSPFYRDGYIIATSSFQPRNSFPYVFTEGKV